MNRSSTTAMSEVVHAGMASIIHIKVANTNTPMIRCSTTVRLAMPNESAGSSQMVRVAAMASRSLKNLLFSRLAALSRLLLWSSSTRWNPWKLLNILYYIIRVCVYPKTKASAPSVGHPPDSLLLHLVHCLLEVGDDIVHVLNANGETYEVGRDSCLAQLFFR